MRIDIKATEKAKRISAAALDNKAEDVVVMDMRAVSNITDFFVISSASSTRRVQAIADGIEEALQNDALKKAHIEGKKEALWVLIDYGDVIVHVFHSKMREFYNLERLWHDAPKERISLQCISRKSKKI